MKKTQASNKILTILLTTTIVAFASTAFAQNASTGPNKVYIEQLGNTNTVSIEQVGGTNSVGGTSGQLWSAPSSNNYGTVYGSNNTLDITQTGDSNIHSYYFRGSNNTYSSTVTGDGNKVKVDMGDTNNQTNLRNSLTETIVGNTNTVISLIKGSDITSTLAVTGNTNEINNTFYSSNGVSSVTIAGNNNKLDIQQLDSAGANGHNLTQNITGDYNSVVTQQQGTNDTTVDISTTGSHNTITVRTSSASIVGPLSAVAR